ncbi:hypothetical protein [Rhizobium sp. CSW-27]|uniref:hypothetical protein n=1 Tax=Rhizobium sp. CSW-27 TaxID=2839985 RepID=UPI001C01F361|nr:hypothetical protein [Rhizobium sp. CSW-27]MBT9373197.1 hypothetical protein [Rhizobium sp. CSW-27]
MSFDIEDLRDCETDSARAAWLLQVPASLLLAEFMAIRAALMAARFLAGLDYLDAEARFLTLPRKLGRSFDPVFIRAARGRLLRIALGEASDFQHTARGESVSYG